MKKYIAILGLTAALIGGHVQAQIGFPTDPTSRQISVKTSPGIQTKSIPQASLRKARLNMLAKREITETDLRALAEYGDGLAALKYVRILVSRHHGQREHASDIAYFGAVAVGDGRVWPLQDMIDAMHSLSPKTEPKARIRKYISVLYPHAWAGNSLALDALIDFNGKGKLFGELSDKTRQRILEQSKKNGVGRVELRMAVNILTKPEPTLTDKRQAHRYLTLAAATKNLAIKATAENLLRLLDADKI